MKRIAVSVGKTISFKGKVLKAVVSENNACGSCYFDRVYTWGAKGCPQYECAYYNRSDSQNIHFINRPDIADKMKGKRK